MQGDEREVPWQMGQGQGSPTPSFCRLCAFFFFCAIFQLRPDRRFSPHHLAPEIKNETVQVFVIRGRKRRASRPVYRKGDHQRLEKKAPYSQWDARTKPHWAKSSPDSKCRRTSSFKFGSDAAHDVEVRAEVPSNRSCRAKKHPRPYAAGHVGPQGRQSVLASLCFVTSLPAHWPRQHCSPSLSFMSEPTLW